MWNCENCGTKGIFGGEFGLKNCPTCHEPRPDTVPAKPAKAQPKAKQEKEVDKAGA